MAQAQLDDGAVGERRLAGQHLVEHDPGAVDVGRGARRPPARLLGGHVAGRSRNGGGQRLRGALGEPRHPEVADPDPAVFAQQHVGGLDVAVDDPLPVGAGERGAELLGDATGLLDGQGAALDAVGEALALDELGDVVGTLVGFADVVDAHDARVADAGQQLRLALEALDPGLVLGPPGLDHLDRDDAAEAQVTAAIDPSERALSEHFEELVAAVQRGSGQVRSARHGTQYPLRGARRSRPETAAWQS